jgi:hypothetical protein
LYGKSVDFKFPIVHYFPFICNKIQATPACEVKISQCMRYSSACASYQYFLKMALLPTRKLLIQRIVKFKLKSSLRKFYSHHHEMVDIYEMSGSHDSGYVWTLVISCYPFKFVSDNFYIILSKTASTIYGGGTVHPSEAPEVTPSLSLGPCWSSWIFSLFTLLVVRLFLQTLWLHVCRLS